VNPNPALFGNVLHCYLGRDAVQVAPVRNESTEETQVELVPHDELGALIRGGHVNHALVIAAFQLYSLAR
jgi:ADP-ribose pyrophosphatase